MDAIRKIYCPIAWLQPGYDPGASGGVATAARQRGLFGLGTLWFDDATSGSRRRIAIARVRLRRAQTATADPAGPGVHRSRRAWRVTALTAGTAGPAGHSSTTDTTCVATGPKAGQQSAAQTDVAARAARGDRNFGRASERFVSERLRRWRPGPLALRLSGERPVTAVTAGTEPVTTGAGVTAPGTSGHGAGHGDSHGLHGQSQRSQ